MNFDSIKQLLMVQFEHLVSDLKYDFLYEDEYERLLCQIVKRDESGSILATLLSFYLDIDEEKGSGEFVFYHNQGEFKRMEFDVFEEGSLVAVMVFVQERLSVNSKRYS